MFTDLCIHLICKTVFLHLHFTLNEKFNTDVYVRRVKFKPFKAKSNIKGGKIGPLFQYFLLCF